MLHQPKQKKKDPFSFLPSWLLWLKVMIQVLLWQLSTAAAANYPTPGEQGW